MMVNMRKQVLCSFLLLDFTDENSPQIHVHSWQLDKIGGKPLPKDEVFSLSDFDIN